MKCTYCSKEMQDVNITAFDLQRGYEEVPFCSVSCLQQWLTGKTIGIAISLVLGAVVAAALAAGMGVSGLMFFFVPYMLRQCHGLLASDAGEFIKFAAILLGALTIVYPAYKLVQELRYYGRLRQELRALGDTM